MGTIETKVLEHLAAVAAQMAKAAQHRRQGNPLAAAAAEKVAQQMIDSLNN